MKKYTREYIKQYMYIYIYIYIIYISGYILICIFHLSQPNKIEEIEATNQSNQIFKSNAKDPNATHASIQAHCLQASYRNIATSTLALY